MSFLSGFKNGLLDALKVGVPADKLVALINPQASQYLGAVLETMGALQAILPAGTGAAKKAATQAIVPPTSALTPAENSQLLDLLAKLNKAPAQ